MVIEDDDINFEKSRWHVFSSRFAMEMWLANQPHLREYAMARMWDRSIYDYERAQPVSDYIFH